MFTNINTNIYHRTKGIRYKIETIQLAPFGEISIATGVIWRNFQFQSLRHVSGVSIVSQDLSLVWRLKTCLANDTNKKLLAKIGPTKSAGIFYTGKQQKMR